MEERVMCTLFGAMGPGLGRGHFTIVRRFTQIIWIVYITHAIPNSPKDVI